VSVPPTVIWPLPVSLVVALDPPKDAPAVEMLAPAGTVMSHPLTVTAPATNVPVAVTGPLTITSSRVEPSKSPPPKPPCTRTSATVRSRPAV
jgi:hypothetical protein